MRRRDRQITDPAAIADLLSRCKVCRIAVTDRQGPYIVPLNFGYQLSESGALTLYFHSAQTGRKLSALQACTGPVAFEMDCACLLYTSTRRWPPCIWGSRRSSPRALPASTRQIW